MEIEKNKRKIRALWWCAVVLSCLALGVCSAAFDFSRAAYIASACVLWVLILLSWYAINQLWYREFLRHLETLEPILRQEKDADRYIAEMESLLKGKRSAQLVAILQLNLCAAYCEKKDYQRAKACLAQVREGGVHGALRCCYHVNLATVLFRAGEADEAAAVMTRCDEEFSRFAEREPLGADIALLRILAALAGGDAETASVLLAEAEERWSETERAADFRALTEQLRAAPDAEQ